MANGSGSGGTGSLGNVVGGAIRTGGGLLLSSLLAPDTEIGFGKASQPFVLGGRNPFFTASAGPEGLDFSFSPQAKNLLQRGRKRGQAGVRRLSGLLDQVEPGASRLLDERLQQIERGRTRTIGNLRSNLASRRLLGSSFATDALTRANREFEERAETAAAESFLTSLDKQQELTRQRFDMDRQIVQDELTQLARAGAISTDLVNNLNNALARSAAVQSEIAAQSAEGLGNLLGQEGGLLDVGSKLLGGTIDDILGDSSIRSIVNDIFGFGGGGGGVGTGGAVTTAGGNLAPPTAQPALGGGGPGPTISGGGAAGITDATVSGAGLNAPGGPGGGGFIGPGGGETISGGGGADELSGGAGADALGAGGGLSTSGAAGTAVPGGFPGGAMGPSGIGLGEGVAGVAVPAAAALVFGKVLHGILTAGNETPGFGIKIDENGARLGGGAKDIPPQARQALQPLLARINERIAAGEVPAESRLSFTFVPGKGVFAQTQRARSAPGGRGDPRNFQSNEVHERLADLPLDDLANLAFAGVPTDPGRFGTGLNLRTENTGRRLAERVEDPRLLSASSNFRTIKGRGGETRRVRRTGGN